MQKTKTSGHETSLEIWIFNRPAKNTEQLFNLTGAVADTKIWQAWQQGKMGSVTDELAKEVSALFEGEIVKPGKNNTFNY